VAALQAQVAALQTRVTTLETYVQKARSACSQFDLDVHAQPVGFKCLTKKGTYFERVSRNGFGEAWKAPDGTIWSDAIQGVSGTFDDAKKKCSDLQGRLPSAQDMEQAYSSGFPEVDPVSQGEYCWTSTTSTGGALVASSPTTYVQQVGDIVTCMAWGTGSGPPGLWTQTTPVYNTLSGKSTPNLKTTRCIAK
jgi:hypothetical protein